MQNTDEKLLISRLLSGDEASFQQLLARYHSSLVRLARGIVGDSEAEDVVQDAWISALKALNQFQGRSTLKTWLFRIVINTAISKQRSSQRDVINIEADLQEDLNLEQIERFNQKGHWQEPPFIWELNSPEAILQSVDLAELLQNVMRQLPKTHRLVVIMHDFDGLDIDSICNLLNITASNVRVCLHRARLKIYAAIEDYEVNKK